MHCWSVRLAPTGRPVVRPYIRQVLSSAPHSCSLLVTFDQRLSPLPRNLGRLIDGGNVVRRRLRARARAAANDGDSVARSISIRAVPRPFAPSFVCSFVRPPVRPPGSPSQFFSSHGPHLLLQSSSLHPFPQRYTCSCGEAARAWRGGATPASSGSATPNNV